MTLYSFEVAEVWCGRSVLQYDRSLNENYSTDPVISPDVPLVGSSYPAAEGCMLYTFGW
jgi:hypothetical protein